VEKKCLLHGRKIKEERIQDLGQKSLDKDLIIAKLKDEIMKLRQPSCASVLLLPPAIYLSIQQQIH
jgi:hypothetical protein